MSTKSLVKVTVVLVTLSSFLLWNMAMAAPQGGTVAQGSANISQSGTTTTINQTSQNTVINWTGFNTASNEAVQFNQPNSSSIALNRITSGLPTTFAGSLTANGQIWILNPAGILFTPTSKIDVSGLVASTLTMSDSNFMSKNYQLSQSPNYSQNSVINNGSITIENDGLVALVAPTVVNNGTITANMGSVLLASGTVATLDPYGDNLINFAPNNYAVEGSASNTGNIIANGGKVVMAANSINNIIKNVVNNGGFIEANNAIQSSNGVVILGGNSGTTNIGGTIKSNRITIKGNNTVISGNLSTPAGGTIETSGNTVSISPTAVIDPGPGGLWYMDPLVIDLSSYGNVIQNELSAGTNVTIYTGTNTSIPGAGTITSDVALSWNTAAVLTLAAYGNITITQPINIFGTGVNGNGTGELILRPDVTGTNPSTVIFSGSGSVNTNTYGTLKLFYDPPSGYANPIDYSSFISGNPNPGFDTEYMMINTQADFNTLMGLVGPTPAVADYEYNLNTNVTYSGTNPMFNNFNGIFDGHNYVTGANSTITASNTITGAFGLPGVQGTFAANLFGTLQNINISASVTNISSNASFVGGVAGIVGSGGDISNVNYSGNVVTFNAAATGGITGFTDNSTLANVTYVSGVLDALGATLVGGIAGASNGGIYSQAIVNSGVAIETTNATAFGGIVGNVLGTAPTLIGNSYTQNPGVLITGAGTANGGIVGLLNSGTSLQLVSVYAGDLNVSQDSGVFDLLLGSNQNFLGGSTNVTGSGLYYTSPTGCGGSFTCSNTLSALAPQERSSNPFSPTAPIYPAIPTTNLGEGVLSSASSQTVDIYSDNTLIASPTSDGTGTYVFTYDPNLDPGFFVATTSGTVTGLTLNKFATESDNPLSGLNITNDTVTVISDLPNPVMNSDLAALSFPAFYSSSGNDLTLASGMSFLTTATTPFILNGNITAPSGNITFGAPASVSSDSVVTSGNGNVLFSNTIGGTASLTVSAAGNAIFDDTVSGINNFTVTGMTFINTPSISTVGTQTYNSPVTLSVDSVLASSAGSIDFGSTVDGGINLTVNAPSGDVIFSDNVGSITPLTSLNVTAGLTDLNGALVITTGAQTYNDAVALSANTDLTSSSGVIDFGSTINGNGFNLSTNASPSNSTVFNGNVSDVGALDVTGPANINASSVSTIGTQTYNSTVTLGTDASLSSSGGNIDFGSTVNGAGFNLATMTTADPNSTIFNDNVTNVNNLTVSGDSTMNNAIQITVAGTALFNDEFNGPGSLVLTAANTAISEDDSTGIEPGEVPLSALTINGPVVFTGGLVDANAQTYNGLVTIAASANPTLLNGTGSIEFIDNIEGPGSLTIVSATTQFDGTVGVVTPLNVLDITSQLTLNGASDINAATQNYRGNVIIAGSGAVLQSSNVINIFGTVDGPGSLAVLGNLDVLGTMGTPTPLDSLVVTGNTETSGSVYTVNTQDYQGIFTATGNPVLNSTAGDILFGSTVTGSGTLSTSTTAGNNTQFDNNVTVGGLNITGTTNINGADLIQTVNGQYYSDTVTLNNNLNIINSRYNQIDFAGGGVVGPAYDLSVQNFSGTWSNGILGSVDVGALVMGGSGGSNLVNSIVNGVPGAGTLSATQFYLNAIGIYCVNGVCTYLNTNIPPTQEFILPNGLDNCGLFGCDNSIIDTSLLYIGAVTVADGDVEAVDQNGSIRLLQNGDIVFVGETVYTGLNSHICIVIPDGTKLCLGPSEKYKVIGA